MSPINVTFARPDDSSSCAFQVYPGASSMIVDTTEPSGSAVPGGLDQSQVSIGFSVDLGSQMKLRKSALDFMNDKGRSAAFAVLRGKITTAYAMNEVETQSLVLDTMESASERTIWQAHIEDFRIKRAAQLAEEAQVQADAKHTEEQAMKGENAKWEADQDSW